MWDVLFSNIYNCIRHHYYFCSYDIVNGKCIPPCHVTCNITIYFIFSIAFSRLLVLSWLQNPEVSEKVSCVSSSSVLSLFFISIHIHIYTHIYTYIPCTLCKPFLLFTHPFFPLFLSLSLSLFLSLSHLHIVTLWH